MSFLERYLSFIRTYTNESIRESCIGIDLGKSSCKLLQIARRDNALEILNCVIEPIVGEDVENALRNMLSRLPEPSQEATLAVSGKGTLIRYIDMPKMPLEDLRRSLSLEADKYFPFTRDQIYTDCFILADETKDKKMSVMVVAAKKEIINERIELLKKVQIVPTVVTLNPIAIANVFACREITAEKEVETADAIAILDVGDVVSSLIIIKDCIPRFTRDIFLGGREFTRRISNVTGVDFQQAENLKFKISDESPDVLKACESVLADLNSEIRLSFDYFSTERNTAISKLYLTGGGVMFQPLEKVLSKNLDIPVELWNPFQRFKYATPDIENLVKQNACRLTVALGLALSDHD